MRAMPWWRSRRSRSVKADSGCASSFTRCHACMRFTASMWSLSGLPETVMPLESTNSVSRRVSVLPSMEFDSYTIRTSHAAARLATDSGESGRSAVRRECLVVRASIIDQLFLLFGGEVSRLCAFRNRAAFRIRRSSFHDGILRQIRQRFRCRCLIFWRFIFGHTAEQMIVDVLVRRIYMR